MKASELMIGDWVQDKYMHVKFQVFEISGKTVNHAPHSDSGFLENEIEPIPITSEILRNNGFNMTGVQDGMYIRNGKQEIFMTIKGLCYIKSNNRTVNLDLIYVHELQHVLRLCKIDKEIKL